MILSIFFISNMNVKLYNCTVYTYFSQGNMMTDLRRGGNLSFSFICSSLLNLTVKKL